MDPDKIRQIGIRSSIGIAVSVLFILLNGIGFWGVLYDYSGYISEPITFGVGETGKGVENFFTTIVQISSLKKENIELERQNSELSAEIERSKEIELENQILHSQIGTDLSKDWDLELARILGIDRAGPSEHVVIDLGSDDKVEVGDPVILGDILIGDVRDVYKSTSRVRLVTNRNSNVAAMDRDTRAKGLVRGSLDGLIIEDVLENEELSEGDVIVSWSDELPDSLVIGSIREIVSDPTASTKTAYLNPGVNLENINYVFVVKDY